MSDIKWAEYNIPPSIAAVAQAIGLTATATGGGIDYVNRVLATGGPQLILKADQEAGSPSELNEPCQVLLELMEGFEQFISFDFNTAHYAMLWMAEFTVADCSNYMGGRL